MLNIAKATYNLRRFRIKKESGIFFVLDFNNSANRPPTRNN